MDEHKVWCLDRTDNMMDFAWGTEKSFYSDALRMRPPREVGICWMEIASQGRENSKSKGILIWKSMVDLICCMSSNRNRQVCVGRSWGEQWEIERLNWDNCEGLCRSRMDRQTFSVWRHLGFIASRSTCQKVFSSKWINLFKSQIPIYKVRIIMSSTQGCYED